MALTLDEVIDALTLARDAVNGVDGHSPVEVWVDGRADDATTINDIISDRTMDDDALVVAIVSLCGRVRERQQEEIGRAIDLIHTDNDYDQGMRLLCRLAGRQDRWPTDVKTISIQELVRRR